MDKTSMSAVMRSEAAVIAMIALPEYPVGTRLLYRTADFIVQPAQRLSWVIPRQSLISVGCLYNLDMMNSPRAPRRPNPASRPAREAVLGLALIAVGMSGLGEGGSIAAAQASGPCALLTVDDVEPLASKASVNAGVATTLETVGLSTCRFTWGVGTGHHKLDVKVGDASRMFGGVAPDAIRQGLQASVTAGTADEAISDVGEAAVFEADSPYYVHTTAYVKGRILEVHLDGFDAREKKAQVIELLKLAASRL